MTTRPKNIFNPRATAYLLIAATAMILGYFLGNRGFVSKGTELSPAEEKLIQNLNGIMHWAKIDSGKAFAWLTDELTTVNGSARHIFFEIAKNSPTEAVRHLKMVSNRDTMQYARWGILKGLAEVEQPNADTIAEFILDQPESTRDNLIYNLFCNNIELRYARNN